MIDEIHKYERGLLASLFTEAERLANGKIYEPGQVPRSVILHVADDHRLTLNLDHLQDAYGKDKVRHVAELVCIACEADAQVLVFEA